MSEQRTQELIDALIDAGYEPKSYSGRGMYGRECVSVHIESTGEIYNIAQCLAGSEIANLGAPDVDNLGLRYVASWPNFTWPASTKAEEGEQ